MRKDWPEIERKYVQGVSQNGRLTFPTQRELALEYNIDAGTLGRKAKEQNWLKKKKNYLSRLQAETQQKSIKKLSDEKSELDTKIFQVAKMGVEKIREDMSRDETDSLQLERLSRTLLNLQRLIRLITGESTENIDDRGSFKKIIERRYKDWQNR